MGGCLSTPIEDLNAKAAEQAVIAAEKSKAHRKILLLGAGESGKSTFMRQLKILQLHQSLAGHSRSSPSAFTQYPTLPDEVLIHDLYKVISMFERCSRSWAGIVGRMMTANGVILKDEIAKKGGREEEWDEIKNAVALILSYSLPPESHHLHYTSPSTLPSHMSTPSLSSPSSSRQHSTSPPLPNSTAMLSSQSTYSPSGIFLSSIPGGGGEEKTPIGRLPSLGNPQAQMQGFRALNGRDGNVNFSGIDYSPSYPPSRADGKTTVSRDRSPSSSSGGAGEPQLPERVMRHRTVYHSGSHYLSKEYIDATELVWGHECIREVLERNKRLWWMEMPDNYEHFLDSARRIGAVDFIPSQDDTLRMRHKTIGGSEFRFVTDKFAFQFIDLGGQRSERKKWIHNFGEVDCVIFFISTPEYSSDLEESPGQNRLAESFVLFESVLNSAHMREVSFFLFLNKVDLLTEMVKMVSFKEFWPEYDGDDLDLRGITRFITEKCLARNTNGNRVSVHATTATATPSMENVFNTIQDNIISSGLKKNGF